MTLLISLIDLFIVLLLLRLLIRPNEAYFDTIYRLIYRVTDPVLKGSSYVVRSIPRQVLLSVAALVLLRGLLYASTGTVSAGIGIGMSLLDLFKLLFQAYFVVWFISVLSGGIYRTSLQGMIDRALNPFKRLSYRFRVQRSYYYFFVIVVLFAAYILLSGLVRFIFYQAGISSVLPLGLIEAFLLVLRLFPFPGFFSLVIIIGALLSWVSPDPSNSIVQAIYGISQPLLMPFRRVVPNLGGLDISPIIALLCFQLIGSLGQQIISGLVRS
jgi:YggT family protein